MREDSSQDMSHEMDDGTAERPGEHEATGSEIERAADEGGSSGLPVGVGDEQLSFKYRAMRSMFRGSIRAAHRPTVTGITNVPKTGPVIIASNHAPSRIRSTCPLCRHGA